MSGAPPPSGVAFFASFRSRTADSAYGEKPSAGGGVPDTSSPPRGTSARVAPVIESLVNVADFERVAAEKLEAGVLGYFAGGAGDEVTLRDNVAAWGRWQLRPRVLAGNPSWSARCELLGAELSMPILVAPVAFQRMVDPEGEVAMARAAAAAGTAMCLSTLATSLPAEVAAAAPAGRHCSSSTASATRA